MPTLPQMIPTRQRMRVLLAFLLVILPLAQPFASGSSSSNLPTALSPSLSRTSAAAAAAASDASVQPTTQQGPLGRLGQRLRRRTPRTETGEYSVSLPSRLIYSYANPLIRKASSNQTLEPSDAMEVPDARRMEASVTHLADIYRELRHKHRRTLEQRKLQGAHTAYEAFLLTKALFLHQRKMLVFSGILRLLNTAVQAFPALLVARLLRLVEAGQAQPVSRALQAALTLVAVLSVKMITENQYFHNVVKMSTQVRGALAGLVFDKALRLPGGGSGVSLHRDETRQPSSNATAATAMGVGGVLNLMQSDSSIVESAALQIHTVWDGALQLAIYTSLLYRFLGPSVFYGIAVLLATIPLNSITLRLLNRLARRENQAKDARNKRTAESIAHMKLLKLFGWEDRFAQDISGHRSDELARHASRGIVRAVNSAISNAVPAVVLVVTLTAYARSGQPIVASTIFTAISLFNQLRFPLFFYPMLIDALANGRNAMLRMAHFLAAEEIVPYVDSRPPLPEGGGGRIDLTNGNFLWSVASAPPTSSNGNKGDGSNSATDAATVVPALANVNVSVAPGEIVAVVGGVGSGKSALIKGLLGELSPVPRALMQDRIQSLEQKEEPLGRDDPGAGAEGVLAHPLVVRHGNVAYCSQEAWLPKGTIRDAIVFGREYDEERYKSAIYDAGLDRDIVDSVEEADPKKGQLSHETDVGEHGAGTFLCFCS
jgi:ABC-type multidrug transport system fused ATPase/permease subunit